MTRQDRANRIDVWEHRSTSPFDVSADGDSLTLTGYASTFDPYEMYGGPATGGWIEQLDRRAFDKTLREKPDLHLLINHEGMPLARTKSGTLQLSVDSRGLKVTAQLDRSDPDVQRLEAKMRRGDMDEMSFAFRVKAQRWESTPEFKDDSEALRTITEVSLHKGDVSVVNFGANPTTSAELKMAMRALARRAQEVNAKRADADEDPTALLAALDATLDEACNLVAGIDRESLPAEVVQALDLLVAAELTVDELMDMLGVLDPDDMDQDDRSQKAPPVEGRRGMSVRDALTRQGLASPDGPMSVADALKLVG